MGSTTRRKPWYQEADQWLAAARDWMTALSGDLSAEARAEIRSFDRQQVVRLVFESNRVERAGLSEGETRRLVEAEDTDALLRSLNEKPSSLSRLEFKLGHRTLGERQVVQHSFVVTVAQAWAAHQALRALPGGDEEAKEALTLEPWFKLFADRRFDPGLVRALHAVLASGLLPDDAGVPAGEYRNDIRVIEGADIVLPSPALIAPSMERFCARARELLADDTDACLAAAEVSYEFVRIHPFPDFNGRLSRILMNMVLQSKGLPFPVALKGDAKGRQRYFRSLRLANAGDLKPYAALIAKHLVEACEAINDNLLRAGLPTLRLTFAEPPGC